MAQGPFAGSEQDRRRPLGGPSEAALSEVTRCCDVFREGGEHGHLGRDSGGHEGLRVAGTPPVVCGSMCSGARGAGPGAPTPGHSGAGARSPADADAAGPRTLSGTGPVGQSLGRVQAGLRVTGAGRVVAGVDSEAAIGLCWVEKDPKARESPCWNELPGSRSGSSGKKVTCIRVRNVQTCKEFL